VVVRVGVWCGWGRVGKLDEGCHWPKKTLGGRGMSLWLRAGMARHSAAQSPMHPRHPTTPDDPLAVCCGAGRCRCRGSEGSSPRHSLTQGKKTCLGWVQVPGGLCRLQLQLTPTCSCSAQHAQQQGGEVVSTACTAARQARGVDAWQNNQLGNCLLPPLVLLQLPPPVHLLKRSPGCFSARSMPLLPRCCQCPASLPCLPAPAPTLLRTVYTLGQGISIQPQGVDTLQGHLQVALLVALKLKAGAAGGGKQSILP